MSQPRLGSRWRTGCRQHEWWTVARFLAEAVRGQRAIHVGFADEGMRVPAQQRGDWLHARLAAEAKELVGLDLEHAGVDEARAEGYEAYVADCCDAEAVARLGLAPADVVVAGEIIEHVDAVGPFLRGLRELVKPGGLLIITTPNATRLNLVVATAGGLELNHPDHVQTFSWYTLTNALGRHGWRTEHVCTYLSPRDDALNGPRSLKWRLVDWVQRQATRRVSPFFADGLIAVCAARPTS